MTKIVALIHLAVLTLMAFAGLVDGSTYAVVLLGIESENVQIIESEYELVMLNPGNASIEVEIRNMTHTLETVTVLSGDIASKTIEATQAMNRTESANKTLMVHSTDEFRLEVLAITPTHTEGFLGIPLDSLMGPNNVGNVYEYVVSTFCGTSGYCQMGMAAVEQQAVVKLTFPSHFTDLIFCVGESFFEVGLNSLVTLNKYSALQIETTNDLTGTHLYSMDPFVVFVGTRNMSAGDLFVHMVEQLAPSSQWGTSHPVMALHDTSYGDIVKIASSWPDTEVYMQGFESFRMVAKSYVVTRRLEMDLVSIITATNPIQFVLPLIVRGIQTVYTRGLKETSVIQISGVTYNTDDTPIPVAMVTIPALEHSSTSTFISCGSAAGAGTFVTVAQIGTDPQVNGMELPDDRAIDFTRYKFCKKHASENTIYEVSGTNVSGIVMCENQAIIPLAITQDANKANDSQTEDTVLPYKTTCIYGETVYFEYGVGEESYTATRSFVGYSVLKFRKVSCGNTMVSLNLVDDSVVNFMLTDSQVFIMFCESDECDDDIIQVQDNYNTDLDCLFDAAWYWIRVVQMTEGTNVCFGFGPVATQDDSCTGAPANHTLNPPVEVQAVTFMGMYSTAWFHYDLETDEDCTARVSDWRCEDKIPGCSTFDKSACDDLEEFATNACPQYCGECTSRVDSYGKRFIFPGIDDTFIHVTTDDIMNTYIIVATETAIISRGFAGHNTVTYPFNTPFPAIVWIITSNNAAVTIQQTDITNRIYPVDAFSTEFRILTEPIETASTCYVVTEGHSAMVVAYTSEGKDLSESIKNGIAFTVESREPYIIEETEIGLFNNGTVLQSDRPIGVFCGPSAWIPTQVPPVYSHDVLYRIPMLHFNGQLSASFKLVLQAMKPNTHISVKHGGSDSTYILEYIDIMEQIDVDVTASYEISSNHPIAVGLLESWVTSTQFIHVPSPLGFLQEQQFPIPFGYDPADMLTMVITETGAEEMETGLPVSPSAVKQLDIVLLNDADNPLLLPPISAFSYIHHENRPTCNTSVPEVDDNMDNDCDGLVDEDLCPSGYGVYGIDADLDGDFGGDCNDTITEPVTIPKPPDPICFDVYRFVKDIYKKYCWTRCHCPCSWVKEMNRLNNLTTEEQKAVIDAKIDALKTFLEIDVSNLTSVKTQKLSAVDDRQSSANMGYIGITMFVLVFGSLVLMDVISMIRGLKHFKENIYEGWSHCCQKDGTPPN